MIPQCTDDYHVFGVGIEKIRTVWIEHDPENYGYYEGISGGELYALCECTIASFILKSDTDDVVSVIWDCHRAIWCKPISLYPRWMEDIIYRVV